MMFLDTVLTGRSHGVTVVRRTAHRSHQEADVSLEFIGIDPTTGDKQSPTVWIDREKRRLVLQGWEDEETTAEAGAFTVPGHAVGVPEGEAVISIPAHMVAMIREACDALERADVR
jgi:hypothetical protein